MNQPLSVDTVGVKSLSDIHDQVAGAMAQLAGSAPDEAALQTAYGMIASAFTSALGATLPSRDGTFRATQTSSQTIGELLQRAAQMYEQGDQAGAEKLKAAADALGGAEVASGTGAPGGPGGATGAGTGAELGGQMAGQVGQQVGQLAQVIAQSVQGLAQGLTQLPQQVMQGVQSAVESATKAGESDAVKVDDAKTETAKDDQPGDDEKRAEKRPEEGRAPESPADGARPGPTTEAGRAPEPPPAAKPAQPAQTRPQQSPL